MIERAPWEPDRRASFVAVDEEHHAARAAVVLDERDYRHRAGLATSADYRVDGAKELPLVGRQLDPYAVVRIPGALGR